jgi:nucleotide-binding universal stress UspA family protein
VEWGWDDAPILLPVAFERYERNAAYIAFFIAEQCGANVIAFHVESKTPALPEERLKEERFIKSISGLADRLHVKLKFEKIGPSLRVADEIVKGAVKHGCQAIMMASRREPLAKELFGRVIDGVVRKAPCKVFVAHTPWEGLEVPDRLQRILIPVLTDEVHTDPFKLAMALTSSASAPHVEVIALRVVKLPETTSLEALETDENLKREERAFSEKIGLYTVNLGKFITPRVVAVRNLAESIAHFARENHVDLIVLQSKRPVLLKGLFWRVEYEMASKSPCVTVIAF